MKQKILPCAKVIQHKRSDKQLQYQGTIFTELPYSHHPASLPYPELQKFSPHSHIILFKYPTLIISPTSSKFFSFSSLMYATLTLPVS